MSNVTTPDLIEEVEALLAKATPGPWLADRQSVRSPLGYLLQDNVAHGDDTYSNFTEADCALIARAPELLRRLVEEVKALRERLARLRKYEEAKNFGDAMFRED